MTSMVFSTPIPEVAHVTVTFPSQHVLLATINLESQMNALPNKTCWQLEKLWNWLDEEGELRVGIITGAGTKAFSAGMDLKERQNTDFSSKDFSTLYPPSGFGGLTRRVGKKPIIAAVNGAAYGGGFEIALNCDLVVASSNAVFCLSDVLRGSAAMEGAFPRICAIFGLQRAMLLALTAYKLSAEEARSWGLVLRVTQPGEVLKEALKLAEGIAEMSPDSVIVSRLGVREWWNGRGVHEATKAMYDKYGHKLFLGENSLEGLRAFNEKRPPKWVPSKL